MTLESSLYNDLKTNICFDFDLNLGFKESPEMEEFFKEINFSQLDSKTKEDVKKNISDLQREMISLCEKSPELQKDRGHLNFLKKSYSNITKFNKLRFQVGERFDKGYTTTMKINPGAYEVVRDYTEKVEAISKKYINLIESKEDDIFSFYEFTIDEDIKSLNESFKPKCRNGKFKMEKFSGERVWL